MAKGPGPGGRYYYTATMAGSELFVFGGLSDEESLNDMWALDLNFRTFSRRCSEPS